MAAPRTLAMRGGIPSLRASIVWAEYGRRTLRFRFPPCHAANPGECSPSLPTTRGRPISYPENPP